MIPAQGDYLEIDTPELGMTRRCQVLVISKAAYNLKTGLCLVAIIVNKAKNFPTEIEINPSSVILADQIRSIDFKSRNGTFKGNADPAVLDAVMRIIKLILF